MMTVRHNLHYTAAISAWCTFIPQAVVYLYLEIYFGIKRELSRITTNSFLQKYCFTSRSVYALSCYEGKSLVPNANHRL